MKTNDRKNFLEEQKKLIKYIIAHRTKEQTFNLFGYKQNNILPERWTRKAERGKNYVLKAEDRPCTIHGNIGTNC